MTRVAVVLIAVAAFLQAEAQQNNGMHIVKARPTVCYASDKNEFSSIRPSAEYFAWKSRQASGRTQTTTIEVDYEGFTPEAQAAFQEAVNIWESLLQSPVKIRIRARWAPLGAGILGSAGPGVYVNNFPGAPRQNVWYPVALAEKIVGKDINSINDYDIEAAFSSAFTNWHYGLTGSDPPASKYDLLSVVLHEIGHGLGITHSYTIGGASHIPEYFDNKPVVYETNIEDNTGLNFVNDFNPFSRSIPLENIITGVNTLYFDSPLVRSVNSNQPARLYAPATYQAGSSIAHLDEATYPAGTINSLMTPQLGAAERVLDPGPIVKGILKEIGWTVTVIQHTPLKDTEDTSGPYHIVAKVRSDNGYAANSVTLNYKTTGSFISLPMTATGNANEFKVAIPGGGVNYSYFMTVTDNDSRVFNDPGIVIIPNTQPTPGVFNFTAGPDNTPPVLSNHTPVEIMTNTEHLVLEVDATDNVGLDFVKVEWRINGVDQADNAMSLKPGSDLTYAVDINVPGLQVGDEIEYRIVAQDVSVANNQSFLPNSTDFFKIEVTGFSTVKDNYFNDFNDLSSVDFFGNGFSISNPGLTDGAINSSHPYPAAGNAGHLDFTYSLRTPIRIAPQEAILKFDEIVLVEPGTDGIAWPLPDFFDYVVVEGSKDGGTTWIPLADGYDSRYDQDWLNLWNSTFNGENSTAVANATLYRPHEFDLLNKFEAGDEVVFRFRLFSDPLASGWGWAIDNLKIQIDETPPAIKHKHYDYVLAGTASIKLDMKISDFHGLDKIFIDHNLNNGTVTTYEVIVDPATNIYSSTIDLSALGVKAGDEFQYRIRATDTNGNAGSFPDDGFIKTAIISFATTPLNELVEDFNATSSNITGNFFEVVISTNAHGRMNTDHPYKTGLGIDGTSDFTFMTKKPIKLSATNSRLYYEDIALVEYAGGNVKDYVVVEGTKDGINWHQLLFPYAANAFSDWKSIYDTGGTPGASTTLKTHQFDITFDGTFKAGDVIFVRFRLHSDSVKTGWGWVIDNLNIQSAVTGLEPQYGASNVACPWPNPISGGSLYLKMELPSASDVSVEICDVQGQLLSTDQFSAPFGQSQREYDVSSWSNGVYLIKVKSVLGTSVTKLIKLR